MQQSSAFLCRLVTSATKHFGSIAANQIRSYRTEQLPALLIISRSKATNEVLDAIQGMEDIYESGTFTVRCVGQVLLLSVKSAWGVMWWWGGEAVSRGSFDVDQKYSGTLRR